MSVGLHSLKNGPMTESCNSKDKTCVCMHTGLISGCPYSLKWGIMVSCNGSYSPPLVPLCNRIKWGPGNEASGEISTVFCLVLYNCVLIDVV